MAESTVAYWLSPQQERAWKAQQAGYCGDGLAVVCLEGPLRVDRLKEALAELVARREMLRTVYPKTAGMKTPFQVVLERGSIGWDEIPQAFDLERGPVLAARLVDKGHASETGQERYELLLAMPAMCVDRRALEILVKDLGTLYGGGEIGEEPLSYRQFAQWQKELLGSEDDDAREARAYWEAVAAEGSAPLPLPELNPEPGAFQAKSICAAGEPAVVAKLDALAKATGTAASTILLAAWKSLIWRLTGQERIYSAVECDGRE